MKKVEISIKQLIIGITIGSIIGEVLRISIKTILDSLLL